MGWGLAGAGLGAWGMPTGGWGNYASNQPISVPLVDNGTSNPTTGNLATGSTPGNQGLAANSATPATGAIVTNPAALGQTAQVMPSPAKIS